MPKTTRTTTRKKTRTTTRKKTPPREPLSTEKVLRVALRMADERGIDELSMRNIADELDVKAMSLYNHVTSKEHILDGLVDLVVAEIEPPTLGGDWRAAMRKRALSAHAVLMRHPWATMLFVSRANIGPNMLRYVDTTIGCLREAGFSYPMADHIWNAIDAYVYGFTLQKLNFPFKPEEYAASAAQFIHLIPPDKFPYLNGMSQEIIAGRHDGLHPIELGLDLLLSSFDAIRAIERLV